MKEIIALCGIGICVVFMLAILREMRGGYTSAVIIGFSLIVFIYIITKATPAVEFIKNAERYTDSTYTGTIFRALGITYLTGIAAEICRSAGEGTVGGYIETAGKIEIMALAVPLFHALLEMALI